MIVSLLSLLGCHVFESISIECVAGMPCAGGGGGDDTDTGGVDTADSGETGDTAVESGPLVESSVGFVVAATATRGDRAYVYDAEGALLALFEDFGTVAGPVAYDDATGEGALVTTDGLVWLVEDQVPTPLPLTQEVSDLALADGFAWLATELDVVAMNADGETRVAWSGDGAGTVGAIAAAPGGGVWITRIEGGVPSLYAWSGDGSPTLVTAAFDTTGARARVLFAGPDDEPHTCSAAGGVYAVADLAAGNGTPAVYYDGGLTDVAACGWDPGDETWLLFSPSAGALRVDAQGRATVAVSAPDGFTLVSGNFH